MHCKHCGFENREGASFCIYCGARFDETIICPNCGDAISADSKECPSCKAKIPYDSLKPLTVKEEKHLSRKERGSRAFERLFNILSIGGVLLALAFVVAFLISVFSNKGDYAYYNMVDVWQYITTGIEGYSSIESAFYLIYHYIYSINMWLHVVAIVVASFFAIGSQFRNAVHDKKYMSERYLMIIYAATILLWSTLVKTQYITPVLYILLGYLFVFFAFLFIYRTYYSFEKGRISRIVEKVIFSFSFVFLSLTLVSTYVPTYLFSNGETYYLLNDAIYWGTGMFTYAYEHTGWSNFLTFFILANFVETLIVIMQFISASLLIYFGFHFALRSEEGKAFKIPYHATSTVLLVLSSLTYVLAVVVYFLMQRIEYGGFTLDAFTLAPFIFLIFAIFNFAMTNTALILTKRNYRVDKILKEKSKQVSE